MKMKQELDEFMDALDEFPFFDAPSSFDPIPPDNFSSSAGLRRRRKPKNTSPVKPHKFLFNIKDDNNTFDSSVITDVTDNVNDASDVTVNSPNSIGLSLAYTFVGLVFKAIAFQTSVLLGFVTFPIWFTYSSYLFFTDPFAIMRRVKGFLLRRVRRILGNVKWVLCKWVNRNKSTWRLCVKLCLGLFSSVCVGFVLVGLVIFAVVVTGVMMNWVVDKPVRIMEELNFDYTRDAPMAFVPIMSCPDDLCLECGENIEFGNVAQSRVIPVDHKLLATVSLNMPESDYNRNLGIFQVRVDYLSYNGKSLASKTQPCMLQFKSLPIRLLMTILKLAPLITGYSAESQILDIRFKGYTEREIPTSCLRVVLEPRAEFAKSGGIPEIYTAYLKLESQPPLLKRILWSWKATIFVWTTIVVFTMGLLFMLLCCMPVIIPWLKPRVVPSNNNGSR
ncbi:Adipose-regulatory protein, Seipin [Artemisia annua]|uniref:Adipose-regulatory protein, Seipin n=1 Tax=Artemisia annua TaxID=35608 RepID=A0A2U1N6Z4_ARTAN|nr:Adipose-regulatory protein, Seipin [Artemisia annua]